MRKGQISLFIIIGILMLVVVGATFYIILKKDEVTFEEGVAKLAGATSEEQRKIQTYVQECLDKTSVEAVEILRAQGGYINFPEGIETLKTPSDVIIYENNGKHIKKGEGEIDIPYYLMGDQIRVPPISFMQRELEEYITEQVSYCVDNFEAFEKEGIGISSGRIDVIVYLEDIVLVRLDYPIEGVSADKSFYLNEFSTEVRVDIPKIQDYVIDLIYYEMQDKFLEKHANQIISMYQYQGGKKKELDLPPKIFIETNLDCHFETWTMAEVEEDLKSLFEAYYPLVRFADTYMNTTGFDSEDIFYDAFVKYYFPTDKEMLIDLSFYPDNPFELNVRTPMKALKPFRVAQTEIPFLPQICIFKYLSKYDINMPILFTLEDSGSKKIIAPSRISEEKGLVWKFYMDTILYGNQNRVENNIMSKYDGVAEEFAKANNISLDELGFGKNGVYYNLSDSRKTFFVLKDPKTNKPLEGVDVEYSCGGTNANKKFLGRTNEKGEVEINVDTCNNGTVGNITLNKRGYTAKTMGLNYFFETLNQTNSTNVNSTNESTEKEYTFDFTLDRQKIYKVKIKGLHLPTFVNNYYLTYGFTKDTCDGKKKEKMLKESYYELLPKDEATYSFKNKGVKRIINPGYQYPAMNNLTISKGMYEVSIGLMGDVVIKPATIQVDGKDKVLDFDKNPLTHKNYVGIYDLGRLNYEYYFTPQESYSEVLLTAIANYNKKDDLNVLTIGKQILQSDGSLKIAVDLDRNCNGVNEKLEVFISKDNFYQFITPVFS